MAPGIKRTSFARCLKDANNAYKYQVWVFTGQDPSLINVATNRVLKSIGKPVQHISGKTSPLNIFHTFGELDLMADNTWVLVMDDVKKIANFDVFKAGCSDSLQRNYLVMVGENVDEGIQRWVTDMGGKIVSCDRIENRQDFLKVTEQIFRDANIQLTESSINALLTLTGQSVGSIINATKLLRHYYDPSGAYLELDYNDIVKVVPALNYEDVFSVITEVLYGNMKSALDYYHKLTERDSEIHFLFLDRMLSAIRDIWMYRRLGEFSMEQQEDLALDTRTYRKIKNQNWNVKDEELFRVYSIGLGVLESLQSSSVKPDFIVEAYLIYIIRMLRGGWVGEFPTF